MNKTHLIIFIVFITGLNFVGCTPQTKQGNIKDISEDSLLTLLQYQTFQYFWDGAEPTSGMARERIHMDGVYPRNDQNVITIGGSGFGVMAILVGIDRGFITREEGFARLRHIVDYLAKADRFHGVWPHWLQGETGKVKPFGNKDDGGDLVETAFMIQGLLAVAQYFQDGNEAEKQLTADITKLWHEVEWDWYTQGGQDVLYWHWSPNYGWEKNHKIRGYNECLITYVLAACSPTHPVKPSVYDKGWTSNGAITKDTVYYGLPSVLNFYAGGNDPTGPLFWAHYSYLGLCPKGLTDKYADYWKLNQNQALMHYRYAVDNPLGFEGYGEKQWGMTSSYSIKGYVAHHPGGKKSDVGVISPTAALSSFPYTPEESMQFLKYLYFEADSLVGKYGPYDAYSQSAKWYTPRYLAIDQGPIPVMVENYRTGLLWDLFMNHPDVQNGLKKLGFKSPYLNKQDIATNFYVTLPAEKREFPEPLDKGEKPGFAWRGTKGWAWTPEQTLMEIPYLKKCNMNFFMNCYFSMFNFPVGDNQWWLPLPDSLKKSYEAIVKVCKSNDVEFCFAMNPNLNSSRHIKYNDENDFESLWQHYGWMVGQGVNWFCVCLDDISEGIDGVGQARVVNKLYDRLKSANPAAQVIFCPTIYASAWLPGKPENVAYLKDLAKHLHPDVYCFWTGDDVRGPISLEKAKEFRQLIDHRIFVWDNYPVNNGVQLMSLGPVVYRDSQLNTVCDGYMSNPMRYQNELNRIPLFTTADYTWNPKKYDPLRSIGQAILHLAENQEQAELFRDVTDVYYGILLGPDRHCNTARVTFSQLLAQKHDAVPIRLFVHNLENILHRFEVIFPSNYSSEKETIRKDVDWMKDQMLLNRI